jgi:GNAT superfamily N-acetyltransferase
VRGHSGFFPGYSTELRHFPDRGITVALIVNASDVRMRPGMARWLDDLAASLSARQDAVDQGCAGRARSAPLESVMTTTMRFATPADLALILEFIQQLAEYEKLRDACVATEERLRSSLFGDRPAAEVLIAECDGTPAGFALFCHNYSTFLAQRGIWLEDLFVNPAFRGRGIGRALLERLAALALERECGRLEWNVLDWNAPAIGFYRSLGAVPMDEWTTFRLTGPALASLALGSR